MVGAFVHADVMVSMIDGSNTRRPPSARTRSRESNTALSSSPILHVPTGRGSATSHHQSDQRLWQEPRAQGSRPPGRASEDERQLYDGDALVELYLVFSSPHEYVAYTLWAAYTHVYEFYQHAHHSTINFAVVH